MSLQAPTQSSASIHFMRGSPKETGTTKYRRSIEANHTAAGEQRASQAARVAGHACPHFAAATFLRENEIESVPGRADEIPFRTEVDFVMCRNIKTLFNFDPPVTDEEVRAASLQFVRKITGFNKPSKANEASFAAAVDEVASISSRLLHSLETTAPAKNREEEAAKAKARAAERFGR
jgi:hypothetical protein